MKTETGIYLATFSLLALLTACAPMQSLTSVQDMKVHFSAQNSKGDYSHGTLAKRFENFANEMQVKANEQREILKNKPSTSFLGRNGQHIKPRIFRKIHTYEQAARENFAKAAYHRRIAKEQENKFAKPVETHNKLDKAKVRLKKPSSTEADEKL